MSEVANALSKSRTAQLLEGMLAAWEASENMVSWAEKSFFTSEEKKLPGVRQLVVEIAYDLQAGSYVSAVKENPKDSDTWCAQVAGCLDGLLDAECSLMEVGVGEGTTLAGVLINLKTKPLLTLGFDISFARLQVARDYLQANDAATQLFGADLLDIPLEDNAIDVVYSSHSLEPNGGMEGRAVSEVLRVASRYVVLVEPIYELASPSAQRRMDHHGYVKGLKTVAERLGAKVVRYELLPFSGNPLNPSGVLMLEKVHPDGKQASKPTNCGSPAFACPLTGSPLLAEEGGVMSTRSGVSYPVVGGFPMLQPRYRFFSLLPSLLQVEA